MNGARVRPHRKRFLLVGMAVSGAASGACGAASETSHQRDEPQLTDPTASPDRPFRPGEDTSPASPGSPTARPSIPAPQPSDWPAPGQPLQPNYGPTFPDQTAAPVPTVPPPEPDDDDYLVFDAGTPAWPEYDDSYDDEDWEDESGRTPAPTNTEVSPSDIDLDAGPRRIDDAGPRKIDDAG